MVKSFEKLKRNRTKYSRFFPQSLSAAQISMKRHTHTELKSVFTTVFLPLHWKCPVTRAGRDQFVHTWFHNVQLPRAIRFQAIVANCTGMVRRLWLADDTSRCTWNVSMLTLGIQIVCIFLIKSHPTSFVHQGSYWMNPQKNNNKGWCSYFCIYT